MPYDLNLFIVSDGNWEGALERQCNSQMEGPLNGDCRARALAICKEILALNADFELSEGHSSIELNEQMGSLQIMFFDTGGAGVSIPYGLKDDDAKSTMVRLHRCLRVFGRYGYFLYDGQCDLVTPLIKINDYFADALLSGYLGAGVAVPKEDKSKFLPGVEPMQLSFAPSANNKNTADKVQRYFAERANYQIDNGVATYANPNTLVSFQFVLPQPTTSKSSANVTLLLDWGRPNPFAVEADGEIKSFIEATRYKLINREYGSDGQYSSNDFFEEWNLMSPHAIRLFLFEGGELNAYSLTDGTTLEAIWQWNSALNSLRAAHCDGSFVVSMKRWMPSYPAMELELGWKYVIPIRDTWIAIPSDDNSRVRVVLASQLDLVPCDLKECASAPAHAITTFSKGVLLTRDSMSFSRRSFTNALLSFSDLVQIELVGQGRAKNKESGKSCLMPHNKWLK